MFPVILGMAAVVFIRTVSYYRNGFPLLSSLGSLTLTLSLFLALITALNLINMPNFREKCKSFFVRNKITARIPEPPVSDEADKPDGEAGGEPGGLVAIPREEATQAREAGPGLGQRVCTIVYILLFAGIATWRVSGMFRGLSLRSFAGHYRHGIVDAVLLLVVPCVAVLYLKMRRDGSCRTDRVSRDVLMLFSYVSFIYAAVIAAAAALNINILVVLPWVYYAATAYVVLALAVNIVLGMLKGDVLAFEGYTLIPIVRKKGAADSPAGSPADSPAGYPEEKPAAQWKVSLKSLYTIRYTLAIFPALVLALAVVLLLSTAVFVVQPHQQAAVYRFGRLGPAAIKSEGLHCKFPWPIDRAAIYDVHRVASMQIGYESPGRANYLWTQMHDGGEYMLLLGNGNEIAAVNLKVMYVISDLYAYVTTCTNAEAVLNAAAYNALMSRTINTTLDSFLSVDRNSLSASVLDELSRFCAAEKLGFSVVQVIVESIHPPVDLADVYQRVVSASVDKTTLVTRAQTYAEAKVIEAQRDSTTVVNQARAVQFDKVSAAQREMAVYYAAMEAYRISPRSFQLTRYLDVYEKIISGNKVYVFSPRMENSIAKFVIGRVNTVNLPGVTEGVVDE